MYHSTNACPGLHPARRRGTIGAPERWHFLRGVAIAPFLIPIPSSVTAVAHPKGLWRIHQMRVRLRRHAFVCARIKSRELVCEQITHTHTHTHTMEHQSMWNTPNLHIGDGTTSHIYVRIGCPPGRKSPVCRQSAKRTGIINTHF